MAGRLEEFTENFFSQLREGHPNERIKCDSHQRETIRKLVHLCVCVPENQKSEQIVI